MLAMLYDDQIDAVDLCSDGEEDMASETAKRS